MTYPSSFITRTTFTRVRLRHTGGSASNNINTQLDAFITFLNGSDAYDQKLNGSHAAKGYYPFADATYTLGDTSYGFTGLYLENGATDGGSVYFNGGSTAYLQSNAAGTTLAVGGFTTVTTPALICTTFDPTGVVSLGTATSHDIRLGYSTGNVSNPPTDAELDSAFSGTFSGYSIKIVSDNFAAGGMYLAVHNGSDWWYAALTKAL